MDKFTALIVAGIATIPSRVEQLKRTLDSLLPQVDKINLSLNNFIGVPLFLYGDEYKKVELELTQGTDEQKFRKVEGEIFLGCDDDLTYPYNYVAVIREALTEYDIVTFHGRSFQSFPIQSYYKSKSSRYRCLDKVAQDIAVQFGGTGCMAFNPERFKLSLADLPNKFMADIQVANAAKRQGLKIVCLAHEAGWIKYQEVPNTIYDRFKNADYDQTRLVNAFYDK